ncbi:MAG: DUF302 domain-containing protein [Halovenus sp.]
MDRRTVLAFGGVATVGSLAGCLGSDDDGNGTEANETELNETETNGTEMNDSETDDSETNDSETDTDMTQPEDTGVVTVQADEDSVDAAFDRIRSTIEDNEGLGVVAELDHRENAASVDMELPPTRVIFFGNPQAGTPLMQTSQRAGLDLPQRMLVWDDDGEIKISYNDPEYIAQRHGIEGQADLLDNIAGALEGIATDEM